MSILMIIGELGEAFKVEGIYDLKKNIDIYSKRMNVDQNEICLFDRNGKSINLNEIVSQESKFFIFNKVFYKEQLIKIFDENVSKYISSFNNNNIVNLDVSPLKFLSTEASALDKYNLSEGELKTCDEILVTSFESSKGTYRLIKQNTRICEKMKENYSFQFNSLECLYKNISNLYEQVLNKYKEVEGNLIKMVDRNEKSLNQFKESIEKLKKTEIHPKMQDNGIKYLIDIYFDEVKMNEWKEKCLKSQDALSKKIKLQATVIHEEKNKIRNEKNQNMINLKNEWNAMITEYDNLNENDTINTSIITSIQEDIKSFHKLINTLIMTGEGGVADDLLNKINLYKNKNFKDLQNTLDKNSLSLELLIKKMKNLLIKSSVTINIIFTNYHNVKRSLLEVDEKLGKYASLLESLEKDFSYLLNPKMFPIAYNASIIEIKRRLIFNSRITKDFEKLKQTVIKENFQRKQFIEEHGRYLTNDYVPLLKFTDLKLVIEFENNDEVNSLPQILDEEDYDNPSLNTPNQLLVSQSLDNGCSNVKNSQNFSQNLLNSNRRNEGDIKLDQNGNILQTQMEFKQLLALNQKLKDELTNLRESQYKKIEELNKAHENQLRELQEKYQSVSIKLSEYEIIHNIKEKEIKKLIEKIEQRDRKITNCQGEIERLGKSIESLNENFISQIKTKDEKLREKVVENENLIKNNLKNSDCIMCKDSNSNSLEYQTWNPYIKDLNEKLIEKNRKHTKLESRFDELVRQTQFIKRTFFNHCNSVISAKNNELMILKQHYESRLMSVEDSLTGEKHRCEQMIKESQKIANEEAKRLLEEETKIYKQNYKNLEKKYNDMQKEYNDLNNIVRIREKQKNQYENEIKGLRQDNENLKNACEGLKNKDNNLGLELKSKENIVDNLKKDIKSYEKDNENNLKKIKKLNEDIDEKVLEIEKLTNDLEKKSKKLEEIEISLTNTKAQHIDFMTNVHKANQFEIEKLKSDNEKLKGEYENYKMESQLLIEIRAKELEELSGKMKITDSSKEEIESLKKTVEELNYNINSLISEKDNLKKKNEEMIIVLNEKEKKIADYNELTKLYLTDNNFLSTTKNISNNFIPELNTNTFAISSNMLKYEIDEFVSVKKLEKGVKAIFVPHSAGIYVCINLNNSLTNYNTNTDNEGQGTIDSNCDNKFFKCNAILSLEYFDSELKELLMEHSLIIIGRIGKVSDHYANSDNNPYSLPEDNNYLLCDLDKIDYILGFQGEEMIFRNYIY